MVAEKRAGLDPKGWRLIPGRSDSSPENVRARFLHRGDDARDPVRSWGHVIVREGHEIALGMGDTRVASVAQALLRYEEVPHLDPGRRQERFDGNAGAV